MTRRDFITGSFAAVASVGRLHLDAEAMKAIESTDEEPPSTNDEAWWLDAREEGRRLLAEHPGSPIEFFEHNGRSFAAQRSCSPSPHQDDRWYLWQTCPERKSLRLLHTAHERL